MSSIRAALIVAGGGTLGTGIRAALIAAFPSFGSIPVSLFVINVGGAFALGLLLEGLARIGEETPVRRRLRLLIGTGVLGGFTSYSSLAVACIELIDQGETVEALGYGILTVILGLLAAFAGIRLARRPRGGER